MPVCLSVSTSFLRLPMLDWPRAYIYSSPSVQVLLPGDNVSLCRPGSPETHYVDQTVLEFRDPPASASITLCSQILYWLTFTVSHFPVSFRPGDYMLCHGHCKLSYRECRFYYFPTFIYLVWTRVTDFVGHSSLLRSDTSWESKSFFQNPGHCHASFQSALLISAQEFNPCSRVSGCGDYHPVPGCDSP